MPILAVAVATAQSGNGPEVANPKATAWIGSVDVWLQRAR